MLTNADIAELIALRHDLHRHPELSGQEVETAARVVHALGRAPDKVVTGLGGHGVAAVFDSGVAGPSVLFRCELDALPIHELSDAPHRSAIDGKGHLCGHDGHMTVLLGLGRVLARKRPATGRVILMFQPAEEDGSGAAAVIADPRYEALRPDWAFSLHNWPGCKLGECWLAEGAVNCASVGLKIILEGKTSHAAQPERGVSPGLALAQLIPGLAALGPGGALGPDYRLATVTHAVMGEPSFGVSPARAEIWVTLRTLLDAPMAALRAEAEALAQSQAQAHGLRLSISYHDDFAASVNNPEATRRMADALDALGIAHSAGPLPERASEDFGRFGAQTGTKGAMVFLGAGLAHPALHNPDYDFPDDLIPIGTRLFAWLVRDILG
ncbi:amidohydrolase [Pseudorhodobacter wandonensis]|uniref:amidohydrolase n=1 Tax=Pseudorhodobacter wandonensis TaxID=1120568 RepID=UPI00067C6C35|nr:amidohydrolase [Pseudorhodobacter wandonensis]